MKLTMWKSVGIVSILIFIVLGIAQCSSDKSGAEEKKITPTAAKIEATSGELRYKKWCVDGKEILEVGSGTGGSVYMFNLRNGQGGAWVMECESKK